ncbi:MAG TPA: hypothetical protein VK466_12200, partial [Terriglobales bacterium]|nr:hypothetical protein [Terriglobales bacterium]
QWVLLVSELFLFALILVLPQVDLPDITFRDGGAPVIARAQFSPPPAVLVSWRGFWSGFPRSAGSTLMRATPPASLTSATLESRLLVCALLC